MADLVTISLRADQADALWEAANERGEGLGDLVTDIIDDWLLASAPKVTVHEPPTPAGYFWLSMVDDLEREYPEYRGLVRADSIQCVTDWLGVDNKPAGAWINFGQWQRGTRMLAVDVAKLITDALAEAS